MLRLAIVANTPPPYRVPIFQKLGRIPGIDLRVIFCSRREPNRLWDLPPLDFSHVFLKERYVSVGERYIHNNLDVIPALRDFAPHVVVTDGFNPTHLYGFLYAWIRRLVHVPMTDGTDVSEQSLSAVHRAVRHFVFARSHAFVSASVGGDRLYQRYGIPVSRCFHSCLCIDNTAFSPRKSLEEKTFDFIFCGRMEPGKSPLFALNVALAVAKKTGRRIRILFVGSGSQEENVKRAAALQPELLDAQFNGFAAQQELPSLYRSARIFLFPTLGDVWGVVANEACAAGLPVIASPQAGVAGELVLDGKNGYVCDLDIDLWAERAVGLLTQPDLLQSFSECSLSLVTEYTFDKAAIGLLDACRAGLEAVEPDTGKARSGLWRQ
jgi:glycosyltransferase involved in cell wall biosynthesis